MYRAYKRIKDLVETLGGTCFIGDPPGAAPVPYSFVWGPLPIAESVTVAGIADSIDVRLHLTVVDESPANVQAKANVVAALLQGAELAIPDWRIFGLKVTSANSMETQRGTFNEPTNQYPASIVLEIRLRATKE